MGSIPFDVFIYLLAAVVAVPVAKRLKFFQRRPVAKSVGSSGWRPGVGSTNQHSGKPEQVTSVHWRPRLRNILAPTLVITAPHE